VAMRLGLDVGDADSLRRAAHTLKSTSATVGAMLLSAHCLEIERLARSKMLDEVTPHVTSAEQEAERVLATLQTLRERYSET